MVGISLLSLFGNGMRQNAIMRSGKRSGRQNAVRKRGVPAVGKPIPLGESRDHSIVRNGVRCAGVHLLIDLHEAKCLDDIDYIEAALRRCVNASRATLLHMHLHHFHPNGVTGVAVLAESHISIHTWPDAGYAALDIFMCGDADPDACVPILREAFAAKHVGVNELLRGQNKNRR